MNTIRQAILKAADHIEAHPELFDFHETNIPGCGTPGCALGWIGFYAGIRSGSWVWQVTEMLFGEYVSDYRFYDRMKELVGPGWISSSVLCSKGLRLYADEHHPEQESYPEISKELDRIFSDTRGATV